MPTHEYEFEATAYVPPRTTSPLKHSSGKSAYLSAPFFASTASTISNAASASSSISPAFSSSTASSSSQPLTTAALDSPTASTRVLVTGRISPTKDKRDSKYSQVSSSKAHTQTSSKSTARSPTIADGQLDELDSVAALEELWNAYQQEKSRAASYHTALESLTIKHTQLQSTHSTTLTTLHTLQHQSTTQSSTIAHLNQQLAQLTATTQSLQQSHAQYRKDVYGQIEQLKRDFVATQANYEATLEYWKRGGEGKQQQLDAMRRKLAAYKQQMGDDSTAATTTTARKAREFEVFRGRHKQDTVDKKAEEQKHDAAVEDEESVIDFRAEVEITRAGKGALNSKVRQLTLGKERMGRAGKSVDKERFHTSHSTDSCNECEQKI